MTDRYAVIGNPVAHSKSPVIHAEFARQTGQDLVYERILVALDGFALAVTKFRAGGGKGLNVTLPFKLDAFRLSDDCSLRARDAEAVNTLKFEGASTQGDNTDGVGLVRDLQNNLGCPVAGRAILLMGSGGAAQGALGPLLDAGPSRLVIANRTIDKAEQLAQRFRTARGLAAGVLSASGYAGLTEQAFDIVINSTSASLSDAVPDLPVGIFARDSLAYDMMYGKGQTAFLELAAARGARRLADGIGMLVEQAAESFFIWRGVRPQTRSLVDTLKAG